MSKDDTTADIITDVSRTLYGDAEDARTRFAAAIGLSPRVLRDVRRGHANLSPGRVLELAERQAHEAARVRDAIKARLKKS
jgi:hypothetical protein